MNIGDIIGGTRRELLAMPWPEYKAFPALNCSAIVKGQKSLLHLRHQWEKDGEDTDAMQFGRLVHCLLFEPAEVADRYRPWEGTRRGTAYDEYCELAEAAGAEVVRAAGQYSMASALDAATGFLRNPRVQELIKAGQAEQTVLVPEGDVQCKGRLDWVSTAEHALVDLKTTAEIEPELFGRTFYRFGYDIKLGMYRRWLNAVTGDHWPVEVIVLESQAPYDVATIPIPDAVLDGGVEKALAIIDQVRAAIETDRWPGIAHDKPMPLIVPHWVMAEDTEVWRDER